jgi:hypothetical protein
MQKVVGKILFDYVSLVAAANDELVDSMRGVRLHDVPQNGFAADLDHRLGSQVRFLGNTRTEASG